MQKSVHFKSCILCNRSSFPFAYSEHDTVKPFTAKLSCQRQRTPWQRALPVYVMADPGGNCNSACIASYLFFILGNVRHFWWICQKTYSNRVPMATRINLHRAALKRRPSEVSLISSFDFLKQVFDFVRDVSRNIITEQMQIKLRVILRLIRVFCWVKQISKLMSDFSKTWGLIES